MDNLINKFTNLQNELTNFLKKGGGLKKKKEKDFTKLKKDELITYFDTFIKKISLENTSHNEWLKQFNKNEVFDDQYSFLYPNLDDPNFNQKIASKKEFTDTKYDDKVYNVKEHSEKMCNERDFELLPHQTFVRNFLSFQTPYNNLLLFHGLGTGKTCSAISVCEEMRDYLKQMQISKRIIIVASPNVQENFKLQLFDERKLENTNGIWTMKACSGNKFLDEINPMKMRGFSKKKNY